MPDLGWINLNTTLWLKRLNLFKEMLLAHWPLEASIQLETSSFVAHMPLVTVSAMAMPVLLDATGELPGNSSMNNM